MLGRYSANTIICSSDFYFNYSKLANNGHHTYFTKNAPTEAQLEKSDQLDERDLSKGVIAKENMSEFKKKGSNQKFYRRNVPALQFFSFHSQKVVNQGPWQFQLNMSDVLKPKLILTSGGGSTSEAAVRRDIVMREVCEVLKLPDLRAEFLEPLEDESGKVAGYTGTIPKVKVNHLERSPAFTSTLDRF